MLVFIDGMDVDGVTFGISLWVSSMVKEDLYFVFVDLVLSWDDR